MNNNIPVQHPYIPHPNPAVRGFLNPQAPPVSPPHKSKTPIAYLYTTSPAVLNNALASLESLVPNLPYRPEANPTGEGWVRQPNGELHYIIRLAPPAGNGDGGLAGSNAVQKFTPQQKEMQMQERAQRFAERQARQENLGTGANGESRGKKRGREADEDVHIDSNHNDSGSTSDLSSPPSSSKRSKRNPPSHNSINDEDIEDLIEETIEWETHYTTASTSPSPSPSNLRFPTHINIPDIGGPQYPVSVSSSSSHSSFSSSTSSTALLPEDLALIWRMRARDANPEGHELWTDPTRHSVVIDARWRERRALETEWLDRVEDEREETNGARAWLDSCMGYVLNRH